MSPRNNFLELYKRALAPVNTQLHSNCQADAQNNRNVLTIIVDTTKICDRRNLPVKGHSECKGTKEGWYVRDKQF